MLIHMVEKPAGAGDKNFAAAAQGFDLRGGRNAAIDRGTAKAGALAKAENGLVDLLGQFTCRREDQGAALPARPGEQFVQNGQHKSSGLAGAGLSRTDQVVSVQNDGDGGGLYRCGYNIACSFDSRYQAGIELELFKTHYSSFE